MRSKEKLMNQISENSNKKKILDLILVFLAQIWAPKFFLQVLPLLVVRQCSKLSSHAISMNTNEPKLKKRQET